LEKVYSFEPMVEGISEADAHHILGLQGSLWTEWIMEPWYAEMLLYPRAFAIAETGWTQSENKNWPDFEERAYKLSRIAREWGYNAFIKP
jgi:hexosaminidase